VGCGRRRNDVQSRRAFLLDGVALPERTMIVPVLSAGLDGLAVTYHAPPGVSWRIENVHQARRSVKCRSSSPQDRGDIVR
jgi:hypothetical protein